MKYVPFVAQKYFNKYICVVCKNCILCENSEKENDISL